MFSLVLRGVLMTLVAPRLPALDVLRGVAILLVIGRHLPAQSDGTTGVFAPWTAIGWVGVDLFFVASGYLLTRLLLVEYERTGTMHVGRFLWRRAWRLYPAYWALLLATAWWVHPTPSEVVRQLLFLQNYLRPASPSAAAWGHTWSLAVEEHFYLLLPGLLLVAGGPNDTGRARRLALRLVILILAVLVARLALHPVGAAGYWTHVRLDAPAVGVLLAVVRHDPTLAARAHAWRARWLPGGRLLAVGLLALSPALVVQQSGRYAMTVGYTGFALGAGALLWWSLAHPPLATPHGASAPLRLLGRQCYAIYLVHQALRYMIPTAVAGLVLPWSARVALYAVATAGAAWALHMGIERPALALRDWRWPARATPAGRAVVGP
jgi:peptidoglycan/LPS O-acetylase OafA/YrhL